MPRIQWALGSKEDKHRIRSNGRSKTTTSVDRIRRQLAICTDHIGQTVRREGLEQLITTGKLAGRQRE